MAYVEVIKAELPDDLDASGPWGVYECSCAKCGINMVHVALVEAVESGQLILRDEVCSTCENMPHPN